MHPSSPPQDAQVSGVVAGMDITTGEACSPEDLGVYDNYRVKRQLVQSAGIVASQVQRPSPPGY
jgi:T-complex protein 1 subunit zeta